MVINLHGQAVPDHIKVYNAGSDRILGARISICNDFDCNSNPVWSNIFPGSQLIFDFDASPSTFSPTLMPTANPTLSPTTFPTSLSPTTFPTPPAPSTSPTFHPSLRPTFKPSKLPTFLPTIPTLKPSSYSPTVVPTEMDGVSAYYVQLKLSSDNILITERVYYNNDQFRPTRLPTLVPTPVPTRSPTLLPSANPTLSPTTFPTSLSPTSAPTLLPSVNPTLSPTTLLPSANPTLSPTTFPTSSAPTTTPTTTPTTATPAVIPYTIVRGSPEYSVTYAFSNIAAKDNICWAAPDRYTTYKFGGDPTFYFVLDLGQQYTVESLKFADCLTYCSTYTTFEFKVSMSNDGVTYTPTPVTLTTAPCSSGQLQTLTVGLSGRYLMALSSKYQKNSAGADYIAPFGYRV